MPRILKNIRIDEVSAVTKGAGEGTRIEMTTRVGASSSPVVAIGANGANGVN